LEIPLGASIRRKLAAVYQLVHNVPQIVRVCLLEPLQRDSRSVLPSRRPALRRSHPRYLLACKYFVEGDWHVIHAQDEGHVGHTDIASRDIGPAVEKAREIPRLTVSVVLPTPPFLK